MAFTLFALLLLAVFHEGGSIMCHRCDSSMGGCSDHVVWRMFPWRPCGDGLCVKITMKIPGQEPRITRDCERNLMKDARHRLIMPVRRRHGFCLPGRKNDPANPLDLFDSRYEICFCEDWNGCNTGMRTTGRVSLPLLGMLSGVLSLALCWRSCGL